MNDNEQIIARDVHPHHVDDLLMRLNQYLPQLVFLTFVSKANAPKVHIILRDENADSLRAIKARSFAAGWLSVKEE